jgi:hypothetical protein
MRIDSSGNVAIGTTVASQVLTVNGNVQATSFISTSDVRLKENITRVPGLSAIDQINGVSWDWIANGKPDMGVIAQNVETVLPNAVVTDPKTGFKAVKYNGLIAPLIESVKELHGMCRADEVELADHDRRIASVETANARLAKENASIKAENAELKARLKRIEEKLGIK